MYLLGKRFLLHYTRCKAQPGIAGLGYGETVHPTLHLVKLFSERRHARDFLRGRLHVNRLSYFRKVEDPGRQDEDEGA